MYKFANKFISARLEAIDAIKESKTLILFMWWSLFSFAVSFSGWVNHGYTGPRSGLPCWPHFLNCKDIFPLEILPYGYGETTFYTLLLALIVYGAYSLYNKNYLNAYFAILVLWFWKVFVISVTYGLGNFDYYDVVLILVFLFFTKKLDYLRFVFVGLYFIAATIKISTGWIDGTYFTTLQTGLPLFPNFLSPFFTNAVIFMQIVGAWFLFSKNKYLYNISLCYFIFFHLYSTILVGYRYPLTALLTLIILFGIDDNKTKLKDLRPRVKDTFNWVVIFSLICLQFVGIIIAGNQKVTLEGNNYGLYMFEANHQCISSYNYESKRVVTANADSRNRCDPYLYLQEVKKICKTTKEKVSWTFDHSINGESLYRIVNEKDACLLVYKPFTHNEWINIKNPAHISEVNKNIYDLSSINKSKEVFTKIESGKIYKGNSYIENASPVTKTKLQDYIYKNSEKVISIYWFLWICTGLLVFYFIFRNKKIV